MKRSASVRLVAPWLLLVSLTACPGTPPFGPTIDTPESGGEQQPASILVSGPKLYSRAALINERNQEVVYLEQQLANAASETFAPQLLREFEQIKAVALSLSAKLDPAAGINFSNSLEVAELKQDIARTQLEMELESVKRDLELLRDQIASRTQPVTQPGAGGSVAAPTVSGSVAVDPAAVSTITTRIDKLIQTVTSRLTATAPRAATSAAHPLEIFEEWQAYRARIQRAINAVALDELHDLDGNSLYRFQFDATVLPPKSFTGFGVVEVAVEPPDLKLAVDDQANPAETERTSSLDGDQVSPVDRLYPDWLERVAQRLNSRIGEDQGDLVTLNMGTTGLLFELIYVALPLPGKEGQCPPQLLSRPPTTSDCAVLYLPVSPYHKYGVLENLGSILPEQEESLRIVERVLDVVRSEPDRIPPLGSSCMAFETAPAEWNDALDYALSQQLANTLFKGPISTNLLSAAEVWRRSPSDSPADVGRLALQLIGQIREQRFEHFSKTKAFLMKLIEAQEACETEILDFVRGRSIPTAPPKFVDAIRSLDSTTKTDVYAISPREITQRISTAARAAQAFDLAASISASIPSTGLGLGVGGGVSRSVGGKLDALERNPLAVGYVLPDCYMETVQVSGEATVESDGAGDESERRETTETVCRSSEKSAEFGWLLGPKLKPDPENEDIAFAHSFTYRDLGVDVSIPSWWPYVTIKVATAWAPNWEQRPGRVIVDESSRSLQQVVTVPLQKNSADLDALTELLQRKLVGINRRPLIVSGVVPDKVSVCGGETTLLIRGAGIWRATDENLDGVPVKAGSTKVLPDMSGISVVFNMDSIAKRPTRPDKATLWIGTPHGSKFFPVELEDTDKCLDKIGKAAAQPAKGKKPKKKKATSKKPDSSKKPAEGKKKADAAKKGT